MNSNKIREFFPSFKVTQNTEADFVGISIDSRKVKKDELFVAIKGENYDGHNFIEEALKNGASGVVLEKEINVPSNIVKIVVRDSRTAYAELSNLFFEFPSSKLKLVGITGTMGKTTTGLLLYSFFRNLGMKCGFIGTAGYYINDKFTRNLELPPTTPESFEINRILSEMVKDGVTYAFIEVTSHSIKQKRIAGLKFYDKILTNIGVDHLDFHKTFEDYLSTKVSFFKDSVSPILNFDSKYISKFQAVSVKPLFFSREDEVDLWSSNESESEAGLAFDLNERSTFLGRVFLKMFGEFNVSNFLAMSLFALKEKIEPKEIFEFSKRVPKIPGRMELIEGKVRVVIDFAHNPGEFRSVLSCLKEHTKGNLIVVFGVVGFSNTEKRIEMGKIASDFANYVYITTDDPRGDDLFKIANDTFRGVDRKRGEIILDRKSAIRTAVKRASGDDVVAILGRGDELVVHYKDRRELFTDEEIVKEALNED